MQNDFALENMHNNIKYVTYQSKSYILYVYKLLLVTVNDHRSLDWPSTITITNAYDIVPCVP